MNGRAAGLSMALGAGVLWGLSGTVAQLLMQKGGLGPAWLVAFRMATAGPLLLAAVAAGALGRSRPSRPAVAALLLAPWRERRDRWRLVVFALLGFVVVQGTYLAAIDAGNAATATFLQYLAPGMVSVWQAWTERRLPSPRSLTALALGVGGTFLLATGGGGALALSPAALAWGLLSAAALAFYTVYPAPLLARYGAPLVTGWAMVVGAVALAPWVLPAGTAWHASSVPGAGWGMGGFLAFVAVGGTLVPFTLYTGSLRRLLPAETSLVASVEPLAAALAAGLWLGVRLSPLQQLGAAGVMAMVALVTLSGGRRRRPVGVGVA
ncbi:MAG: EamA family transporter [Bacillota bacterium]|nr:EamA family transporter [Bacillota bacterium]